ncbi:MAG: YraN family protein, partial [Planctomycetota bacterium]|nr:YraN family protein [Planctomycetota bacterium]
FLKKQGYKIIDRNFRCKFGEIDLIAYKKKVLSFIEVKTRSSSEFGSPFDAIDKHKKQRLRHLTNYYIYKKKIPVSVPCQFDVIAITLRDDKPDIQFVPNALND